jgi:hypothetical protein
MTRHTQRTVLLVAACLIMAASTVAFAKKGNDEIKTEKARRPTVALRVDQTVGMAPMRVRLTADLVGGADDYQPFYCPAVEWDWGDGTESDASFDCQPYQPHISQIVRHFSVEHVFEEGEYGVTFRLKRDEKELASVDVDLLVD